MQKNFKNGLFGSNTYVVWDESTLEAMIIDCGNEPREIEKFCIDNNLNVKYIVLTHGHYDHADFACAYKAIFQKARLFAHEKEKIVLCDSEANVSYLVGDSCVYPMPDISLNDGDILTLGDTSFTVLHTPGHTPGGICLYCEKEKLLFTGDTLFAGGRGRTDFKYGDERVLLSSLARLCRLDGETEFYSGHGEKGIIKNERYLWL